MLHLLLAAIVAAAPAAAQQAPEVRSMIEPTSSVHVQITGARVTGLDCRSRGFNFELTRHSARHFPYMTRATFTRDPDPRSILVGIFSMLLLVPVTVISVPADLIAMPFRKECDFTASFDGTLQEWAGRTVPEKPIALGGRNIIREGVEGVAPPVVFYSSSTTTADANGRFSVELNGHIGKDKELLLQWTVDSRKANTLSLKKGGGTFMLSEEDPGFGTGVHENEPREIQPEKKKRD
ncbi:MAG: hypothetical protein AUJ52_15480 [Elusimicrobia bacterium CG1_02_63_36]|nr:MAG: hypothetical protein AUJ52_15480 [Elusimicrobia bacterium CG1_02_63_36]